jgi:hypothetical protein
MADPIQGERIAVRALLPATAKAAAVGWVSWVASEFILRMLPSPSSVPVSIVVFLIHLASVCARAAAGVGTFLFLLLLLHRLVNARFEPPGASNQSVLTPSGIILNFSWPFQIIAYVFFVFAVASIPIFFFPTRDWMRAALVALLFLAFAVYSFFTMNFPRVVVSPSGLDVRLFRDRRQLTWAEIAAARIDKDSLLVTTSEGKPLKLSIHLRHIDLLLDELDRRLRSKEVPPNAD